MIDKNGIEYTDSEILAAILCLPYGSQLVQIEDGWVIDCWNGDAPTQTTRNIVDCLIQAGLLHDKRRK